MNEEKLKYLLNRFYSGTSTPEMEEELRNFFAADPEVSNEFTADKAMFQAMNRRGEMPANLEKRIVAATTDKQTQRKVWIMRLSGIAAMIAIIVTLAIKPAEKSANYREITDPTEAYAILCMIDAELQSAGLAAQASLMQVDEANKRIETTINQVLAI